MRSGPLIPAAAGPAAFAVAAAVIAVTAAVVAAAALAGVLVFRCRGSCSVIAKSFLSGAIGLGVAMIVIHFYVKRLRCKKGPWGSSCARMPGNTYKQQIRLRHDMQPMYETDACGSVYGLDTESLAYLLR